MADEIRIRLAVPGDERALAVLIASVHELHVVARPDVFKPAAPSELAAWAAQAVVAPQARVVLAESAGAPTGYAVVIDRHRADNPFAFERRWREVEQLGVHPEYRRRGVARALLEHIAETARADGIPALELNTWIFNATARAAFERLGFVTKMIHFERSAK